MSTHHHNRYSVVPRRKAVVTTEQLQDLLAAGKKVYLPAMAQPAVDGSPVHAMGMREIKHVVHAGTKPVKCISIDDRGHLYITDDLLPTHNTSNIVFLKSTDDTMLDMLSKLSGTKHKAYRDSKTVTRDMKDVVNPVEGKLSYTISVSEEPVISFNDLVFLSERNSIVFRAGDPPVWNRNETILPMSWRLFKNTIEVPGKEYSLQTIPTLSSAADFDVRFNQPNFTNMLTKRVRQAVKAQRAEEIYQNAYGYSDFEMSQLDPDVKSRELMDVISTMMRADALMKSSADETQQEWSKQDAEMDELGISPDMLDLPDNVEQTPGMSPAEVLDQSIAEESQHLESQAEENTDVKDASVHMGKLQNVMSERRYAGGRFSRDMLVTVEGSVNVGDEGDFDIQALIKQGTPNRGYDEVLVGAYEESVHAFGQDDNYITGDDKTLTLTDGTVLVEPVDVSADIQQLKERSKEEGSRVYADDGEQVDAAMTNAQSRFSLTPHFHRHLASQLNWNNIAGGKFQDSVIKYWDRKENASLHNA